MDSEDELPALERVEDTEEMPALEPVVVNWLQPPAEPEGEEGEDSDGSDMPLLMSVSDSSNDEDRILSVDFTDEEEDDWEDEDEDSFGDDLSPLERFPGVHSRSTTIETQRDLDAMPPLIHTMPSSNPQQSPGRDPSWLPPRRRTRSRSVAAALPDFFDVDMRSVLEVLHLGPTPSDHLGPEVYAQFFHDLGGNGQAGPRQSEPDLERAQMLVDGLEVVSEGLLSRMTRVGGAPGAHEDMSGEDENVTGCAVCWSSLVEDKTSKSEPSDEQLLPFASESGEESKIVCLPCAHVFHGSCLLPWFSRKTTCPTCRFDIDPRSLTWRPRRQTQPNGATNQMPMDDWEDQADIDDHDVLDDLLEVHVGGQLVDSTSLNGTLVGGDLDPVPDPVLFARASVNGGGTLGGVPINNESHTAPLSGEGDRFRFQLSEPDYNAVFGGNLFDGSFQRRPTGSGRTPARKTWTLPDAPGKSLRERIVEKERDMGLRCLDATCVVGPTDEDPCPDAPGTGRQILIKVEEDSMCQHTIHPACLVMSARVAGWTPVRSSEADHEDFSAAEVSCPSCRAVGTVSREDWEEGLKALEVD